MSLRNTSISKFIRNISAAITLENTVLLYVIECIIATSNFFICNMWRVLSVCYTKQVYFNWFIVTVDNCDLGYGCMLPYRMCSHVYVCVVGYGDSSQSER